jgi:hypothetical protein
MTKAAVFLTALLFAGLTTGAPQSSQPQTTAPQPPGRGGGPPLLAGPPPTQSDVEYAPAEPPGTNGQSWISIFLLEARFRFRW